MCKGKVFDLKERFSRKFCFISEAGSRCVSQILVLSELDKKYIFGKLLSFPFE